MGFYKDKINLYSKNEDGISLDKKMFLAKEQRENDLYNEYKSLLEERQSSITNQFPIHGASGYSAINNFYKSTMGQVHHELKTISEATPKEYFLKLAMQEHVSLGVYANEKFQDYLKTQKQIAKSQSAFSEFREFFGKVPNVKELLQTKDELQTQYCQGDKAFDEWKSLTEDEQTFYLANRAYYEQQYAFSSEEMDRYAQEVLLKKDENEEIELEEIDLNNLKINESLSKLVVEDVQVN